MNKVCLVAVCYNSHDDAVRLLSSIEVAFNACSNVELDVLLCDNSTVAPPVDFISQGYSYSFRYLKSDNVGYFPAFAKGLDSLGKDFDYVIVSNVDLMLAEGFFTTLRALCPPSDIGVIAPSIWSSHRKADLNPKILQRVSREALSRTKAIFRSPLRFYLYTLLSEIKARYACKVQSSSDYIYAPHGSLIIFTRAYFVAGARVDYPRFLFGEEVFVGEECLRAGVKVLYAPSIKVCDRDHGSTSLEKRAFIAAEHVKSLDYLINAYFKS